MKSTQKPCYLLIVLALLAGMLGFQSAKPVQAANALRISQVYGGGGLEGATFTHDFFEIFNSGSSAVSLNGMSIQYASGTGSGNLGGTALQITELPDILLEAGQYYLIQGASGSIGDPLPLTPDLTDTTPINASGSAGKVALINSQESLGCNGGSTACDAEQLALIVDLIGYGITNFYEGSGSAPLLSSSTSAQRADGGCTDTDDNAADFEAVAPVPRNSTSPTNSCGPVEIFPTDLFFSEYIEGSSNNKALEIYNGTEDTVDLSDYKVELYSNGSDSAGNQLTLEGYLPSGDVYVIANSAADASILAVADITSTVTYFNGNDALLLRKISTNTVIDSIGQVGNDPGSEWGTEPITTEEHTLIRKDSICEGDPDGYDFFDPAFEWDGYAQDYFTDIGSHITNCLPPPEEAPEILSTVPVDGGSAQTTGNIIITFSEPVTVVEPWFSISCGTTGAHSAAVTDTDPVFTLNPDTDFEVGETCTVTIDHTMVNDDDLDDATADYMVEDYTFSFTIIPGCGDEYIPIYEIQGTDETSPLVNQTVTTEGVVVGDFQVGGKNGYYIQEPDGDGNPATSDGIFVYNTTTAVDVGDRVRVEGKAVEYYGITEISPVTQVWICSTGNTIEPTEVTLPVTDITDFEKFESMLVTFPQSLIISEYFNYDRYGEIVLTSDRHMTPTALVEPGPDAVAAAEAYLLDRITLDDGRTTQNPDPAIHPNGFEFTLENLFRGGGTVTGATGILDYYQNLYRLQPTTGATYENINPRTAAPDIIESDLKVTSFNVLNYFVTLDDGVNDICGPSGTMECRGADDSNEFDRQKAKIVSAMTAIDADIFGLMEIENEHPGGADAVADLVAGINAIAGTGTYAYIDTGAIGTDAIKQAILYKPASVTPVGTYKILDSSVDPRFIDDANRPVLAQVFMDNATGEKFVVAVNHLKSKGSACDGDPDLGDGQGNCNLTRLAAAEALVDWLADTDIFPDAEKKLIIGDLNSYDKEDPIDAIKLGSDDTADTADDYLDMIFEKRGEYAYGYVYDGQTGYLDHALANQIMAESIVDVNFWHINADEPDLIDYDTSFKLSAQDALYAPDAYRSSDHDPVIVTLSRNNAPVGTDQSVTTSEDTPVNITLAATDQDGDALTYAIYEEPLNGIVTILDSAATYTPNADYIGTDSFTFKAFDGSLYSTPATVNITVTAVNDAPVAVDDAYTTNENEVLTIDAANGVLANDTDVDSEVLTAVLVDDVSNGTLALTDDGSFVYTPVENFLGSTTFTYKVSDGALESNIATVTITVNDPPVAEDNSATTDEDVAVGVTLLASDTEGNPLTYAVVAQPANGSVTLEGAVATYTPNPDYNGPDSFTFKANDGTVDSNVATITITINPVNDAPVLDPIGPQAGDEETLITFTATASDIDLPEQVLTFSLVDAPADAEIDQLTGVFTWTPTEAQGPGEFTFTVQVCDDDAVEPLCDTEEITVTVNEVNVDPVLDPIGAKAGDEGNPITFTATATDVDVPSQALTFSLTGTLPDGATISEAGVFTWTPTEAQGPGEFTFTVQVCDDADPALCDSEEITVTVNEVNLAPELDAIGAQTGDEGTLITFTAAASDADVPAQVLTYSLTGTVPDGAAIDTATGVFTWTPTEAQGPGEFTFTVQVCDSPIEVLCDYEEITVTVNEVNVAPELDAIGAQTGDEGTQITFTATASDVDLPAQVLAFGLVDAPADAEIDELTGFFTWTPADPGLYTLTVQVCDDAVEPLCDTEEITITVGEVIVNTPPVAVADAYSTDQDTELVVAVAEGVLANDTDANADALIAEVVDDVASGTLDLAADGSFTYTPKAGFVGEDSFTYKASDGVDYSDVVTVTITVSELTPTDFTIYLPLTMK